MSLKILVDMNLSTDWIETLKTDGWDAVHWSTIGDPRAEDAVLMAWALANGYMVFTHDLDFGTALALTSAVGPSVLNHGGGPLEISSGEAGLNQATRLSSSTRRQEEMWRAFMDGRLY